MSFSVMPCRFELPLINAGDLLYAEVAAKTALGLEAKGYTDSSKTVPDELLLKVLLQRLAAPDCATQGWLLDGFPHTSQQVKMPDLWHLLVDMTCDNMA